MMLYCHLNNGIVVHIPASVQMNLNNSGVFLVRLDLGKIEAFFKQYRYLLVFETMLKLILSKEALDELQKTGEKNALLVVVKTCSVINSKYDKDFIFREAELQNYLFEKEPLHIVPLAMQQTKLYFRTGRSKTTQAAKVTLYRERSELPRSLSLSQSDDAEKACVQERLAGHIQQSGLASNADDEDWCSEQNIINGCLYHDFGRSVLLNSSSQSLVKKRKFMN